ncbi:MAG: MFS transporter [Gemmataceae bacterium]
MCTLIGMTVIGRLADRFERLPLFRVLAAITVVVTLGITNLPPCPLWMAAMALSMFMVFTSGRMVPAQAMLLGTAQPRVRGAFMSLNTAVQHLSTGISPMIAGLLVTKHDDTGQITGFWLVGIFGAVVTLISMLLAGWVRSAKPMEAPQHAPVPEAKPKAEPAAATA